MRDWLLAVDIVVLPILAWVVREIVQRGRRLDKLEREVEALQATLRRRIDGAR